MPLRLGRLSPRVSAPVTVSVLVSSAWTVSERCSHQLRRALTDQPPIFCFGRAVKTSSSFFEAAAIKHHDLPAGSLNEAAALKIMNRFGHTGPTDREHQRQKFMREHETILGYSIVRHQKPAGQPLRQLGAGVGDRGMAVCVMKA